MQIKRKGEEKKTKKEMMQSRRMRKKKNQARKISTCSLGETERCSSCVMTFVWLEGN